MTESATPPAHPMPEPAELFENESGDEIFARLVLPEVDVMWRVAMSLTHNRADAEDVVQESLLRAYRSIHTFDGRYPRAWLLTIVRNTERNRHRRRRPELLSDPDSVEDRGPATEPDEVERYAEDREFDTAVTNALAEVPETFRRIIELVDMDGLTYQEAADLMEIPLGTVMSRLHRGRRRLRDLLVPLGFGPPSTMKAAAEAKAADAAAETNTHTAGLIGSAVISDASSGRAEPPAGMGASSSQAGES